MLRNITRIFCSSAVNKGVKQFPLSVETISKLRSLGITELFPIQQECLQPILDGKDVVAKAKTGTGKTMAFAVPVIEHLQSEEELDKIQTFGRKPRVLTLAPSRELANQTANVFSSLVSYGGLKILPVYGGVPLPPQTAALEQGVDIVVGAPGRVKDLMERGALSLSDVKHVILDEVDRMLDMGFVDDVDDIIRGIYSVPNEERPQTMLFSATFPNWVNKICKRYLDSDNTKHITFEDDTMTPECVRHIGVEIAVGSEEVMTAACIAEFAPEMDSRVIVFCNRKSEAEKWGSTKLIRRKCASLHGDKKQAQRELILERFREGRVNVLFTTDVAARGIDIPDIDLVIQVSPPSNVDSYVHRSGRTGRAGRNGISVCLFTPANHDFVGRVEHHVGIKLELPKVNSDGIFVENARRFIEELKVIPDTQSQEFTSLAEEIITEMGATKAVSLALAQLSGRREYDKLSAPSVLSGRTGYKAMKLDMDITFKPNKSLIFNILERAGVDAGNCVSFVRFTQDRQALVFDVATEAAWQLAKFRNSPRFRLTRLTKCPPLEADPEQDFRDYRVFKRAKSSGRDKSWSSFQNDWPTAKRWRREY